MLPAGGSVPRPGRIESRRRRTRAWPLTRRAQCPPCPSNRLPRAAGTHRGLRVRSRRHACRRRRRWPARSGGPAAQLPSVPPAQARDRASAVEPPLERGGRVRLVRAHALRLDRGHERAGNRSVDGDALECSEARTMRRGLQGAQRAPPRRRRDLSVAVQQGRSERALRVAPTGGGAHRQLPPTLERDDGSGEHQLALGPHAEQARVGREVAGGGNDELRLEIGVRLRGPCRERLPRPDLGCGEVDHRRDPTFHVSAGLAAHARIDGPDGVSGAWRRTTTDLRGAPSASLGRARRSRRRVRATPGCPTSMPACRARPRSKSICEIPRPSISSMARALSTVPLPFHCSSPSRPLW